MINVVVATNRIGRARQAERGVDAQIRFRYGMNLSAMWSRRCTAGASAGNTLPATYADGMFVGQHGLVEPPTLQRPQANFRAVRKRETFPRVTRRHTGDIFEGDRS